MSKKKDSLGSILFRLFFAALFFGGDLIQEFDVSAENIPFLYLGLLVLVIVFAFVANKFKKIIGNFSALTNNAGASGQTTPQVYQHPKNTAITGHSSSSGSSKDQQNQYQTVTGNVVNPMSVNGK